MMCGIAGIVACDGRAAVDPAVVERMCRTIVHQCSLLETRNEYERLSIHAGPA
jgi:hypothetical protein